MNVDGMAGNTRPYLGACSFEMSGLDGPFSSKDIPEEIINYTMSYNVPLDCTWVITVDKPQKVIIDSNISSFQIHWSGHNRIDMWRINLCSGMDDLSIDSVRCLCFRFSWASLSTRWPNRMSAIWTSSRSSERRRIFSTASANSAVPLSRYQSSVFISSNIINDIQLMETRIVLIFRFLTIINYISIFSSPDHYLSSSWCRQSWHYLSALSQPSSIIHHHCRHSNVNE